MKKNKALRLLAAQRSKVEQEGSQKEWLITTTAVLVKIFPLSADYKIEQLSQIFNDSGHSHKLSPLGVDSRIRNKKKQFLEDCAEEIRLLGMESRSDNAFIFARNIHFWVIVIAVSSISYVFGNINTTSQTSVQQKYVEELTKLRNQLEIHQKKIDSLTRVINQKNRVL